MKELNFIFIKSNVQCFCLKSVKIDSLNLEKILLTFLKKCEIMSL